MKSGEGEDSCSTNSIRKSQTYHKSKILFVIFYPPKQLSVMFCVIISYRNNIAYRHSNS